MIGNSGFEQTPQMFSHQQLLFSGEIQRIWIGKLARQIVGHSFSRLTTGSKDQNGPEILRERFSDKTRPISANFAGHVKVKIVRMHLLERHGTIVVTDQDGTTAETLEPFDDVLRVRNAATQQEQLCVSGS